MTKETIRPSSLGKFGTATEVTGAYDWEKQTYQYDTAKWGTCNQTRNGTSSYFGNNNYPSSDDNNMDSYND